MKKEDFNLKYTDFTSGNLVDKHFIFDNKNAAEYAISNLLEFISNKSLMEPLNQAYNRFICNIELHKNHNSVKHIFEEYFNFDINKYTEELYQLLKIRDEIISSNIIKDGLINYPLKDRSIHNIVAVLIILYKYKIINTYEKLKSRLIKYIKDAAEPETFITENKVIEIPQIEVIDKNNHRDQVIYNQIVKFYILWFIEPNLDNNSLITQIEKLFEEVNNDIRKSSR